MVQRYACSVVNFAFSLMLLALVMRARKSSEEGIRLKTAAAMAEAGDLREIVERLWNSEGESDDLLLKVISHAGNILPANNLRKLIS